MRPGCHAMRIAAVEWREEWQVKTVKDYVTLSGLAKAKNCESLESVFPEVWSDF
jgi:hypothetical protein